ncbi:MAG: hypothetical protein RIT81_41920 [Deltaproteobacteria bacterium]
MRETMGTLRLALLAALAVSACATPQKPYQRRWNPAGELVVEQHEVGPILVYGRNVIDVRNDVDHLIDIVECVPEAVEYAEGADNMLILSTAIRYTGFVATIAGIGMAVAGLVQDDRSLLAGAGVLVPVGIIVGYFDDLPKPIAVARSIDAANAYNDQYPTACRDYVRPRRNAPKPKTAPPKKPEPKPDEEPGGFRR